MKLLQLLSAILIALFAFCFSGASAQSQNTETIETTISPQQVKLNVHFLSADELRGRDTGSPEIDIAAAYIANWFQAHGVQPAYGDSSFYQHVPFEQRSTPDEVTFSVGDSTYQKNTDLILMSSYIGELDGEIVYLNHATEEELAETNVEGKIILTNAGLPGQRSPQQFFTSSAQKNLWATEAGAAALIELYNSPAAPWPMLVNFLSAARLEISDNPESDSSIPQLWMNNPTESRNDFLTGSTGETASLTVVGEPNNEFTSRNVIGIVEGSDPELKNEYIMLSAHYDHVGVRPGEESGDFIYNGARDNAVGTAGIMAAAAFFAENPPKRSVIFTAWTAEEKGLLGSRYYAENPAIPLNQTVYNLNIDGAGYNDTTKVTIIGLGRTEADPELTAAAEAFGLEAIPDPVPEQNLFDRSDNVNFASRGIPSPTYSMGLTAFDDEINYYYHRVTDEAETIDFDYVTAYIRSFVYAADLIANLGGAPFWLPGDKYEPAGIELYSRD
jgi:hypothetical protein